MTITTNIQYEVTDTFSGEANYSWVKRGVIRPDAGEDYSDLAAVRRVKNEIGWNGLKCRKENMGDDIALYPIGMNQVCFISFHAWGAAS